MGADPVSSYASSDEVRRRWRELLDAVEHRSEHVIVQRYTRPIGVIVPIGWYEQAQQALNEENENAHAAGH